MELCGAGEAAVAVLCTHLLHEGEQRLLVVLPLLLQLTLMGEFVTAQVNGELQAVGVQVAEVIHTCKSIEMPIQPLACLTVAKLGGSHATGPNLLPALGCHLAPCTMPMASVTSCAWQPPRKVSVMVRCAEA